MVRWLSVFNLLAVVIGLPGDGWSDDPPPKSDPGVLFRRLDANGDGKVSREEFRRFVANAPRFKERPDLARGLFDRLDADRDGFLSMDEFQRIVQQRPGASKAKTDRKEKSNSETPLADKPATAEQVAFFEKKIRPVLIEQCYSCHSANAKKVKGGLLLDTKEGLRKGGDSGPAIVAGDPSRSLLIKAVRYHDDTLKMPPKQKLANSAIADFEEWVRMGAPDPRSAATKLMSAISLEEGRKFWAFQPIKRTSPPVLKDTAWSDDPIDRYLRYAQEVKGVHPVGDANPRALVRRLYFDLIGLPPSPAEVEAFVAANDSAIGNRQSAVENVVDKLLASPQFGERWGRHWLDVARYGETSGKNVNFNYPNAWRYRDWVIAAFNADKPFDRFIKEQIAGDLLPAANPKQQAEQQIATGFLAIGPKDHNERNRRQFEMDVIDEQIDTMSQAFLGLTVGCARCHDHKFDPIPSRDYYALAGIFKSTETSYGTIRLPQNAHPSTLIRLPDAAHEPTALAKLTADERATIEKQIEDAKAERAKIQRDGKAMGNPMFLRLAARISTLENTLASYEADGTPIAFAMGLRDHSRPENSPLYIRGEINQAGERVPRGVLEILPGQVRIGPNESGRKELADWIASKNNPLTARVFVNRVWLHLFGRGLVPTSDNFGASGQPPSHPELLDYLAATFMENGWSVKSLIRRLVLTRAYRLSADPDEENQQLDPDDVLVWRMAPRRLDAECLRDGILAISGELDLTPPVGSPIARAGDLPAVRPRQGPANDDRAPVRSVYLPIVRNQPPEMLALFDFADSSMVVGERPNTTAPSQALFMLNSPFVLRHAEALADRLLDWPGSDADRVTQAYLLIFGRPPTNAQRQAALDFLAKYEQSLTRQPLRRRTAWAALGQSFFASAEFLFRN